MFTGLLCAAARFGCDRPREAEYSVLRRWLLAHYPKVAPTLRHYLEAEFSDIAPQGPTVIPEIDILEAIFREESLSDLLDDDQGDLIPVIGRISEAVYQCDEMENVSVSTF